MNNESLVARLRALEAILSRAADLRVYVENDPLWLVEYGHVEDAVGEAADALERAEKERDALRARVGPSATELNRIHCFFDR